MKLSELKILIREEITRVLAEQPSYTHMKPFTQDIQQQIRTLQVLNNRIEQNGPLSEEIMDVLEILEQLQLKIKQAR